MLENETGLGIVLGLEDDFHARCLGCEVETTNAGKEGSDLHGVTSQSVRAIPSTP
jgi:hypothetical protein